MPSSQELDQSEREWLQAALDRRYTLVRLLGRGAMGVVYLARDRRLQRLVAIKTLLPEFSGDSERREQFRREALTNARLAHPNIVPVYSVEDPEGLLYLTMRYIHGQSLAYRLWRRRAIPIDDVCRILADLASALDYAHRQNVVHRDIKPENVLIDRDTGCTMLTDFGIARFGSLDSVGIAEFRAEKGVIRGTVQYMSPEQAAGEWELDGRSDLYALGVLGYAMLAGRLPFDGTSFREVAAQHAHTPPKPIDELVPDTPPAVAAIIMRCLEKSPNDRWTDGRRLREELIKAHIRGGRSRFFGAPRLLRGLLKRG
ncbi:MAG TPA: serine/threonine-protein kinase [Gemmatimonadaceae bacterium]|nr:serine/threonine-protein kinase [Gemmatimonadaceae bacterium]